MFLALEMFPLRTKKDKYEGLQVHTEGGEELILAARDSLASSSQPQSSPAVQPGESPFHSRPGTLSEKAASPCVTDGTWSRPSVQGLQRSTPRYAARSQVQESYLFGRTRSPLPRQRRPGGRTPLPSSSAVAKPDECAAAEPEGEPARSLRSAPALSSSLCTARPSQSTWRRQHFLFPGLPGIIRTVPLHSCCSRLILTTIPHDPFYR